MKPGDLADFLSGLVRHGLKISTMMWGPPGIGKSSIVRQTAEAHELTWIDLRLSQLAPTELTPQADPRKMSCHRPGVASVDGLRSSPQLVLSRARAS
jgi:hypothetical protein